MESYHRLYGFLNYPLDYKRAIIFLFILFLFLMWSGLRMRQECMLIHLPKHAMNRTGVDCYRNPPDDPNIQLLDDVMTADILPQDGRNIFFHETSCLDGIAKLNTRQACAVESAALANPTSNVFVLFASPVGFISGAPLPTYINALSNYKNVHFRNVNMWQYAAHTPADNFMKTNQLFESEYLNAHMADLLRLISLFKWGGIHLDLDFIVRQSFADLGENYAGAETENVVCNALLNIDQDGFGHLIIYTSIKEFAKKFDGSLWSANGPILLTNVIQDICKTPNVTACPSFKIYPENVFYVIHYGNWEWFFEPTETEKVMNAVRHSSAVHFWNKLSHNNAVRIGDNTAYELLAKEFCPRVFSSIVANTF